MVDGELLSNLDDLTLLSDSKGQLHRWMGQIEEKVVEERLVLHPSKRQITPVQVGIDLLGYHVFPYRRRLRNDNGHRFARKLRRMADGYATGRLGWEEIHPSVQSWIGHACHADTLGLRKAIFGSTLFCRGGGH